jgi:hypothetical protein
MDSHGNDDISVCADVMEYILLGIFWHVIKICQKISFHMNKIYLKYSLLLTRSHNNNPHLVHTYQGNIFSTLLGGHMTALCGWYLVQEYPTKHFLPKPNHWYRQHLLGLWWHSYLCQDTAISQVSVIISNRKNPPIVPFVFSGQSPNQRCQGNFWNSEDPSKTVTWAFWFLELSSCKFHAPKKKTWKKMSISLCMCRV